MDDIKNGGYKNMKILKPQKISYDKLKKVENLLKELEENEKINNINLENYKQKNIQLKEMLVV